MSGWLLLTLLVTLLTAAALVYWQRENDARFARHWERLREQQRLTKDLLPMLKRVANQVGAWERWRDSEWIPARAASLSADVDEWAVLRMAELKAAGEEAALVVRNEAGAITLLGIRRQDGTLEEPPKG